MSDSFDPVLNALNTVMNLRLMNQNVIASNIANADTPGYKAKKLEFEGALRDALGTGAPGGGNRLEPSRTDEGHTSASHSQIVDPEVYDDPNGVESLDGNTVDRAKELSAMVENQLVFDSAAELVKKKLGALKYAISEGGGGGR